MARIVFIIIFLGFLSLAHADTLHLKDGREIEGNIIQETEDFVSVEVGGGGNNSMYSSYKKSNILSIEKEENENRGTKAVGPQKGVTDTETETDIKFMPITPGMSKKEVRNSWGAPAHVRKSESKGVFHERWTYQRTDKSVSVYFENGVLVTWEEN